MRLAAAALLALAAGCTPPGTIKAYQGSHGSDEIGTVVTGIIAHEFSQTDNQIRMVDGVRFEKGGYEAQVLPGARRIGVVGTLRTRMKPRLQHCAFELDVVPGCTYRPSVPAYPRSAYDLPPDADWRLTRPMTVIAECSETSSAFQVPIDCASSP